MERLFCWGSLRLIAAGGDYTNKGEGALMLTCANRSTIGGINGHIPNNKRFKVGTDVYSYP